MIFAVSTRKGVAGIDHLGIKADSEAELAAMRAGLEAQGLPRVEQRDAECCYARADKLWVTDPNGVPWELYAGTGSIEVFGDDVRPAAGASCCAEPAAPLLSLGTKPRCTGAKPRRRRRRFARVGGAASRPPVSSACPGA